MALSTFGLIIASLAWGSMHELAEGCFLFGAGLTVLGALRMAFRAVD